MKEVDRRKGRLRPRHVQMFEEKASGKCRWQIYIDKAIFTCDDCVLRSSTGNNSRNICEGGRSCGEFEVI